MSYQQTRAAANALLPVRHTVRLSIAVSSFRKALPLSVLITNGKEYLAKTYPIKAVSVSSADIVLVGTALTNRVSISTTARMYWYPVARGTVTVLWSMLMVWKGNGGSWVTPVAACPPANGMSVPGQI
eukprot:6199722-Pleurochrysis_carterae.AAC.5